MRKCHFCFLEWSPPPAPSHELAVLAERGEAMRSAGRQGDAIRGPRHPSGRGRNVSPPRWMMQAYTADSCRHFEQVVVEFSEEFLPFSAAKLAAVAAGVVELNVSHDEEVVALEAVADMPE
ncbi:unnamed protein product [Boreogadus saida]